VSASDLESSNLPREQPLQQPALLQRWWAAARDKPVTSALVASSVVYFGLALWWGRDSDSILWYLGANQGEAVRAGEFYRLLSCLFLHLGWMHLALNMVALRALSALELMLGHRRFLLLYFLSGLGASLSTALLRPEVLSVGASGAIWGLMGAAFGMRIPTRHALRARGVRLSSGWQVLALNLGISFVPGVDLTAHLGGGVVGFVLGAVAFYPDPGLPTRRPLRDRLYSLGALLASLALAGAVGVALYEGRPWRFGAAPVLQRVSIGSSGLSIELPEPLDTEPLATQPLADQHTSAGESSEGWRFGVPARSPLAVRLVLLDDSLPPLDPERDPEQQIDSRLRELHDQIEREPASPDLPRTSLELTSSEGRTVLRDEYRGTDQQTVRYFLYVGTQPVALVVWRFRTWSTELWPGVDRRIAASLRAEPGSGPRH
jgi:rhomboid protease GluP